MNNQRVRKSFQNVPRSSYNMSFVYWELVKKMSYKLITFTLILTIFLAPTIQLINAQETEPDQEESPFNLEVLASIKLEAENRWGEISGILGEGIHSSDIMNSLQHAEQAMTQAKSFETDNPQAATQQYLRAMKHWRNALRKHLGENPELIEEFEDTTETTAEDDVETVTGEEIEATKTQLLARFQERFQEQIQAMMQNIEDMEEDLAPEDAEKAQQALMRALERMFRIQEKIQAGQYDEAIDDLEETTEGLEEEFDEELDPGTAKMLKEMNRIESRIQKIVQKAARKAANGEDTSEEDALLDELRGNKNKLKNEFKGNQSNGGQGNQGGQGKGNN